MAPTFITHQPPSPFPPQHLRQAPIPITAPPLFQCNDPWGAQHGSHPSSDLLLLEVVHGAQVVVQDLLLWVVQQSAGAACSTERREAQDEEVQRIPPDTKTSPGSGCAFQCVRLTSSRRKPGEISWQETQAQESPAGRTPSPEESSWQKPKCRRVRLARHGMDWRCALRGGSLRVDCEVSGKCILPPGSVLVAPPVPGWHRRTLGPVPGTLPRIFGWVQGTWPGC